jgi:hypothetical protein
MSTPGALKDLAIMVQIGDEGVEGIDIEVCKTTAAPRQAAAKAPTAAGMFSVRVRVVSDVAASTTDGVDAAATNS